MADQVSDLVMKFVGDDGNPIIGETLTDLNLRKSPMSAGFTTGKMFEVQSFTFKTGIGDNNQDEATKKTQDQNDKFQQGVQAKLKQQSDKLGLPYTDIKTPRPVSYKDFRDGKDVRNNYPVDMKPMEFSRAIDISSPVLLDYCIKRRIFKSASLIKRKAAGGVASGEIFLRFDFTTVLIKSLDWDNDEPIKESCEFVCRAVTINYLPQLPDGSLGAPIQAFWSAVKGLTAEKLS